LLLAWVMAQLLGLLPALLSWLAGEMHGATVTTSLAERLVWFGLTLTGFVVFEFFRRASSPADQAAVTGSAYAWLLSANALAMLVFAGVFGVIVGAGRNEAAFVLVVGREFLTVLAGAFFASFAYVLVVELRLYRIVKDQGS
jgi:hypothetical protein